MSGGDPATVRELVEWGTQRLTGAGIEGGRLDAQLLLGQALSVNRLAILSAPDEMVNAESRSRYAALVRKRAGRTPLAYLRGSQEFYGLEFAVDSSVLIPRPETELLVDFAREVAGEMPVIWDVGTGSGCIAVACAKVLPGARVIASDISCHSLVVAAENARTHKVWDRCLFVHADLTAPARSESVTLVLSNPPYISMDEIAGLQPEIREHEPMMALSAGADGLSVYRRLIPEALRALKTGGWLAVEVGAGQSSRVSSLFVDSGFGEIRMRKDLAGIERLVIGRKP